MPGLFARRRAVRRDAAALMLALTGREGWLEARARAADMDEPEAERGHWSRVAGRIERQLGIEHQTDAVTRYLEQA